VPAKRDDWFVEGCAAPDGTRKVAMKIQDPRAPSEWQRYTDQWIRDAAAGRHTYGRYSWNLVTPEPCPTPSPTPSPTPTPIPTPILPTPTPLPSVSLPIPTPRKTP
jgi:hypothetical protein